MTLPELTQELTDIADRYHDMDATNCHELRLVSGTLYILLQIISRDAQVRLSWGLLMKAVLHDLNSNDFHVTLTDITDLFGEPKSKGNA